MTTWTDQPNTSATWTPQLDGGDVLLNSETSLIDDVYFLGGGNVWTQETVITTTWTEE